MRLTPTEFHTMYFVPGILFGMPRIPYFWFLPKVYCTARHINTSESNILVFASLENRSRFRNRCDAYLRPPDRDKSPKKIAAE